jgi:hypothetical protein
MTSWSVEDIRKRAASVAAELEASPDSGVTAAGGGSRPRGLPEDVRERFIEVRSELFRLGVYDPILVRFDTATVAQASTREIAAQLAKVGAGLSSRP